MNENYLPPNHEEPLSADRAEQLRQENEFLKMKIMAEFGGVSGGEGTVPPEIENQFLKNVIAFESQQSGQQPVKLSSHLGDPDFKKSEELNDTEFNQESERLFKLLQSKSISVDFLRERDRRFQYKFITEELFNHETCGMMIPGMVMHFIYEEFHMDHEMEIANRTEDFMKFWFERDASAMEFGLISGFIQPNSKVLSLEEVTKQIQQVFDSYKSFENCKFKVLDIKFQISESDPLQAMGHSEGLVKYDAVLENGEVKKIRGPFKIYMGLQDQWWSIFFFYMPGFNC